MVRWPVFLPLLLLACSADPAPITGDGPTVASPVDADGDGAFLPEDCNDADSAVAPGLPEVCDGVDQDCDLGVDEGLIQAWFTDADADGFGLGEPVFACEPQAASTTTSGDCDDADREVHPGAAERCDEDDDDCDGVVDEGVVVPTWWVDGDGDGAGLDGTEFVACDGGVGAAAVGGDCDDADASVSPLRDEDCNARDDDCSGVADDDGVLCPCPIEHRLGVPYLFCTTGSDWAQARDACRAAGYQLVTVSDAAEDAWLASTASAYAVGYWWTGANDLATEEVWAWVSGESWSYENFCVGEPNNGHGLECVPTTEEDCGVLSWGTGGCWNDYPCDCAALQGDPYRSICEG